MQQAYLSGKMVALTDYESTPSTLQGTGKQFPLAGITFMDLNGYQQMCPSVSVTQHPEHNDSPEEHVDGIAFTTPVHPLFMIPQFNHWPYFLNLHPMMYSFPVVCPYHATACYQFYYP